MHPHLLGNSKVKVTPIILGTWAIGGWLWGGTDEKDAIAAIQTSIEQGITAIDTAAIYGMGLSEELVGKAIKKCRDKVIIATKCGMRWDTQQGFDPWLSEDIHGRPITICKNLKPESIAYECEQSLKRMQIDTIDLYQIHWPDLTTPIEESWSAMVKLLEEGKVRAIGVSNYNLKQLKEAHAIYPVHSIQNPYSLLRRGAEEEIIPFCENNNIAFLAYSPLERGLLTGKISVDTTFPPGDDRAHSPVFSELSRKRILTALTILQPIAKRHHATFSQLIIHCTSQMPGICSVLIGARNAQQAMENARASTLQLSQDEHTAIVSAFSSDELQFN